MAVTINGTTGVAVPLGSAAAPAETNTTSGTTGIYYPTSTTFGLSTNGTNAVYIDASQNVGIGTTSPAQKFHVYNAGSVYTQVQSVNASTGAGAIYKNATANWLIGAGPASGGSEFAFVDQSNGSGNPGERMRIDSSGNLQVGGTTVTNTAGYVNSRTNARAWVNFDGTLTTPITPRSNYNVSSVTKNGTGNYTLNFTTSLADANYAGVGMCSSGSPTQNNFILGLFSGATKTTSALQVAVTNGGTANLADVNNIMVAVFGN